MSERLKDIIAGVILIGMLAVNTALELNSTLFVRFVVLFGVLYHAWILGRRLFPRFSGFLQTLVGGTLFFGLFSLGLTAWFYSNRLMGPIGDAWALGGAMVLVHLLNVLVPDQDDAEPPPPDEPVTAPRVVSGTAALLAATGAIAFVLVGAARAATTDSIRTPWPLLPHGLLAAIGVLWITLLLSAWLARSRWLTGIHASLALFATTAIAPILYRIGFGFDGFLHLAGETHILQTGTLDPKPLYYIGQYVFTTWLTRITSLPIDLVDRWLVPVSVALLIPLASGILSREHQRTSPLVLLLLPLASFVATTPQSFAYVLGIAAILLALTSRKTVEWPAPLILAAWSAATHPLAGAPFSLIVVALLLVRADELRWRRALRTSTAVIATLAAGAAVPLLFAFAGRNDGTAITWHLPTILSAEPWLTFVASVTPWIGNHFFVWPAFASLFLQALPATCLIAWIVGVAITAPSSRRPFIILGAAGILLALSGVILKAAGDFRFLIDYERGNYADRLFVLSTFCLAIATLPAIDRIAQHVRKLPSIFSVALIGVIGFAAAAQAYNALPRNDALVTGRGWTVSATDIDAVKRIDRDAGGRPYTVLADQSVSAAAVSSLGFKRYNGDIFFYPIPTGGKLYDVFLRMTYQEPSRLTARDAAHLGGSSLVYVVLNDYWWNAENVAQSLEAIADDHWSVGPENGGIGTRADVYVFDVTTSTHP